VVVDVVVSVPSVVVPDEVVSVVFVVVGMVSAVVLDANVDEVVGVASAVV
jgi:hypothetical protein